MRVVRVEEALPRSAGCNVQDWIVQRYEPVATIGIVKSKTMKRHSWLLATRRILFY